MSKGAVAGSSAAQPPRRRGGPGRPFQKGQSGNPSGLPAGIADVKAAARALTPLAMQTLSAIASDLTAPAAARVSAAQALLDRGWGKAAQPVDGDGQGGPIKAEITTIDAKSLPADARTVLREAVRAAKAAGDS